VDVNLGWQLIRCGKFLRASTMGLHKEQQERCPVRSERSVFAASPSGRSRRRCWTVCHSALCGDETEQGGNACCRQTHLAPLCVHRLKPQHPCQPNHVLDKCPAAPPCPPSLSSPHITGIGSLGPELHTQGQRSLALSCWGRSQLGPTVP